MTNRHELIRVLTPFGQAAYEAWRARLGGPAWSELDTATKAAWSRVADAVLDEYDPEWVHKKAGL